MAQKFIYRLQSSTVSYLNNINNGLEPEMCNW